MKDVLVVGAFGGMGRATVEALSSLGYRVFALDKSVDMCADGVIPIETDITDENAVISAMKHVCGYTQGLFAIIHLAGVYMLDSLVEMQTEKFEGIFNVNLKGVFLVNKVFLPLLKKGSRIIITTSELATLDPLPFTGVYAVTKSALDKYAFSLRMELQLLGISVSVIRAGAVDTGMLGASTESLDRFCDSTRLYSCNAERFKKIVSSVEARCITPKRLTEKLLKILNSSNPSFAYSINRNPLLLLFNLFPKRIQLFLIRLVLK